MLQCQVRSLRAPPWDGGDIAIRRSVPMLPLMGFEIKGTLLRSGSACVSSVTDVCISVSQDAGVTGSVDVA